MLHNTDETLDNESDQFSDINSTYLIFNKEHGVENITGRLI